MNKKCIGCGITLQTKNKNKLGFISEAKYQEGNYCERCFKVINYNEFIPVNLENINEYIINEVNEKAKLVFFLIDLLNINEETIETFNKIKTKKYLVISKSDVIPKSIKEEKLNSWLKEIYNMDGYSIMQNGGEFCDFGSKPRYIGIPKNRCYYCVFRLSELPQFP